MDMRNVVRNVGFAWMLWWGQDAGPATGQVLQDSAQHPLFLQKHWTSSWNHLNHPLQSPSDAPMWTAGVCKWSVCRQPTERCLFVFYHLFIHIFFSTVQHGDPVTHTRIHSFFSHYVIHHNWLDRVPSATEQDPIANPSRKAHSASIYPKLPVPPTSSPYVLINLKIIINSSSRGKAFIRMGELQFKVHRFR